MIQSIPTRKVQTIACEVNEKVAKLTIDSGCEGDCVRMDICERHGIPILPLDKNDEKVPTQADGHSPLEIVGQARFTAYRGKVAFEFIGYVAKILNAEILCGAPFMERNKLVQELHNRRIIVDGKHVFLENSPFCPNLIPEVSVRQVSDTSPQDQSSEEHLAGQTSGQADKKNRENNLLTKIEIGANVPQKVREKLNSIHIEHSRVFDGSRWTVLTSPS